MKNQPGKETPMNKALMKAFYAAITYVGTRASKWLVDNVPEILNDLKNYWTGKSIAIIGPTASGKDHMFHNLRNEDPPEEYVRTEASEKIKTFKIKWPLPDDIIINFRCRKSINVGGEIDQRDRFWLQACKNADVIYYLVDVEKLRDKKEITLKRIRDDLKWLGSNIKNFKPSTKIHFLFNKIDIYTNGTDPDELEDIIKENISKSVETVSKYAQKILKDNYKRSTGFTPISMVDEYLFNTYFTIALQQIYLSDTENSSK